MNYQKIYDDIIIRAQHREKPLEKCDKHHIIPRSLGGNDRKENLVYLTLREHFVCHLLLAKIHGGGMLHAAMMLSSFKRYNSRMYKWLRTKYINERMMGENNPSLRFPWTEEQRKKSGEKSKGRKWINNGSESCMAKGEQLQEMLNSGWVLGRLITPELLDGLQKAGKKTGGHNKGVPMTEHQREKCSRTWFKKNHQVTKTAHVGKKYIHKDGQTKRVHSDVLDDFINNGWSLGKYKEQ